MPNLYATVAEVKAAGTEPARTTQDDYDGALAGVIDRVSRWIDSECKRVFYPTLATKYFSGRNSCELWVPDLVSITSVEISDDDGQTYTALTTNDYYATVAGDDNSPKSYSLLVVNVNSTALSYWPRGQRAIRIIGVWGYTDDRDKVWQDTGDTVENSPLTSGGTSLTVNDVDGLDIYGLLPRFQAGQVLKIESEFLETALPIVAATTNTIGLVRGVNGTAAAQHAQNTAISVWRPPAPIRDVTATLVIRQFQRALQAFGDARASADSSQLIYLNRADPESAAKLANYRLIEFA